MQVVLSLGSNLGERKSLLEQALSQINEKIGNITSRSSFYETAPWGFESAHPFLNGCCLCETALSPEDLLNQTQAIEKALGRRKKSIRQHYEDRCIDIDLIFYGSLVLKTPRLTLPHPLMQQRKFVLEPLNEIAPDLIHPVLKVSVSRLLAQLDQDSGKPIRE